MRDGGLVVSVRKARALELMDGDGNAAEGRVAPEALVINVGIARVGDAAQRLLASFVSDQRSPPSDGCCPTRPSTQ